MIIAKKKKEQFECFWGTKISKNFNWKDNLTKKKKRVYHVKSLKNI